MRGLRCCKVSTYRRGKRACSAKSRLVVGSRVLRCQIERCSRSCAVRWKGAGSHIVDSLRGRFSGAALFSVKCRYSEVKVQLRCT